MDVGLAARGLDEDDLTFDVALAEPEVLGADPDLAVVREPEPLGRLRREEVHRGTADEGGNEAVDRAR